MQVRSFGIGLSCLLMTACTLLLDTSKKQCESDQECWARGLDGAVCVRELCQPAAADSSEPVLGRKPDEASGDTSGMQPTAATRDASPPATEPSMPATRMPVMMSAPALPAAAGAPALPATGAAGAGGAAGSCPASGCPECATDADCERRGMKGAQCIDAVCWAQKAECSSDQECLSMGAEFEGGRCLNGSCRPNPRWRCEATQATLSTEPRQLTILVRDSLSLSALSMVHIVACAKLDLTCANPVAEGTTDRDGKLKISVPASFAGYLQQTERREYAPAMYFLPNVFPEDGVLEPFPLLSAGAIIDALATSLGASTDPDRGHLMLIAEDCMGTALAGATFMSPQADQKTVQFYVRDLLPSTSAKQTAEIGNGGFLNFPSGTAVLNVDRVEGMLHLTTVTLVVRPGFISIAYMRPQLRAPEVP